MNTAPDYGSLLSAEKPEVITGERQNQLYVARLEEFTAQPVVTSAEEKLIALLTVLV